MIKDIKAQNENLKPTDGILAKLHADFPQCFNNEGKFDLEKFRQLIEPETDITKEGYGLDFLGKNYANLICCTESETVIQPDLEHNAKPENAESQNIYISGDNLDALKHLSKTYAGKIKCIYIDPPYNTGSDGFVYNDSFKFTAKDLQTKLGISEEKAKRILDLCTRGSSSHSAWLMFMAPRLMLASNLLKEDGVIFISIDDNEQANLKLLCDSVFGEENFVTNFMWMRTATASNLSHTIRSKMEYILCYLKTKNESILNGGLTDGGDIPLLNASNKIGELVFPKDSLKLNLTDGIYEKGVYDKVELLNDFTVKEGKAFNDLHIRGNFKWKQNTVNEEIDNGTYFIIKTNKFAIRFQRKEKTTKTPSNLVTKEECNVGTNEEGYDSIVQLFGVPVFPYSKPISLIKYLANMNVNSSDIILDFFSGSATTAHAVMKLNSEDGGNRKFIMVQLPEKTPKDSEANKAGYDTIDQIGQERIRRAAAKIKNDLQSSIDLNTAKLSEKEKKLETEVQQQKLFAEGENPLVKEIETIKAEIENQQQILDNADFGFRHYTLQNVDQNTLDKMETFDPQWFEEPDILEQFGKETVLATWLLHDGYGFGEAKPLKISEYTAYHCGSHLYFIEGDNFDENAVTALIDKYNGVPDFNPQNIVLFGYSFSFTQTEMLKKNLNTLQNSTKELKFNIDIRY